MTAPTTADPIAIAGANYRASRAYWMAAASVICPKCKAGFGRECQSTGGGNGGPVPTHKARTGRTADWSEDQRHKYGEVVRANHRQPWNAPADLVAEAEAAAKPIPTPNAKPVTPKGVRLSALQAEEIERFAYNAGKGSTSTGHLSGEHQYRQTIHALRDKGILAEGGHVNHGYEREYTLTAFGWQVYLNHRLIFRHAVGDRHAAAFAAEGGER
ncbi:hypothetical protein MED01_002330 [Micromonospora sp. MED01]|uniref:zinc finger domain-containing protein n=1 Tax=Micromonospora alfalfae TaxID=2911212 RepID=UPI001EE95DF0|nr:hypothetical protein [Micromonospora alfalfae]MCG5464165.1 hypothetical protein [Micromonospora alfalfae]